MVDMELIVMMRIEAADITARAIVQGAAAVGMPRGGGRRPDEAESAQADERSRGSSRKSRRDTCKVSSRVIADLLLSLSAAHRHCRASLARGNMVF
jgi:hypothetical protein